MSKIKNCPSCQTSMREIMVFSHYDSPVFIEQCDSCGGLWFDSLEIYYSKNGVADTLSEIDKEKLTTKSALKDGALLCPNDKSALKQFEDANFPPGLHMDSCPICNGFWVNRAEFAKFQDHRSKISQENKKISSAEDEDFKKQMNELIGTGSDSKMLDLAGNFSQFLMTPVNSFSSGPSVDFGTIQSGTRVAQTAFEILKLIFKLFLK
jgi:Zn-finger nucleic acid-binding protein